MNACRTGWCGGRQDGRGELLTETTLRNAQELFFRERLPWRVGIVRLDAGVNVVAYLHASVGAAPCRVRVEAALDRAGQAALVAVPEQGRPNLSDDPKLREMTCDPRARKILVTDGKTAVGQAVVRALAAAGADLIWIGEAEPWKKVAGLEALRELPQATIVPLDVTDGRSVRELAGEIGAKVDILINTADHHRTFSIASRRGVETAQLEMDVNYLGLAAPRAGIRSGAEGSRGRRTGERHRLGQSAVDLCARQLSAAWHLLGLEGGGFFVVASVARASCVRLACGSSTYFPVRSTTNGISWSCRRSFRPCPLPPHWSRH